MHNTASVLENDTHKFLLDFKIQMDHSISTWRLDLIIINNKKEIICKIMDFAVPADQRVKLKESEQKDKYLYLTRGLKNLWNMNEVYINCRWCFCYSHQRINKGTGGHGNKKSGDHPNYCMIEIGLNTEKDPKNLRRLAVTQTPVKDHQLTLMWKTLQE